jgi:hypothetical protein
VVDINIIINLIIKIQLIMKSYLNICLLFVFLFNLFLIGDSLSPLLQATQSDDYDKVISILKSTSNKGINVRGGILLYYIIFITLIKHHYK